MMEYCSSSNVRVIIFMCILFTLCGVIYFGYFCPEKVCALTTRNPTPDYPHLSLPSNDGMGKPLSFLSLPSSSKHRSRQMKFSFDDMSNNDELNFDIRASDVIVFLHIQKTGGTSFGRHLVQDLDLEKPCDCRENRKRCKCTRPNSDNSYWLFSRYSTGWQCGLHADWTELTNCVDSVLDQREGKQIKRRYFYVSLLREPVQRFLSEFLHVQRGATWKQARHMCGGREATAEELPPCFLEQSWEGVQLDEFLTCSSNLAFNRQTRMLANLELVGCYNNSFLPRHERDLLLLASAKENLRKMAFFGLCEQQQVSQYLFEKTFNMRFLTQFQQFNETHVASVLREVSADQLDRIRQLNRLDLELYEYARALLEQRFQVTKQNDPEFEEHFNNLGRLRKPDFKWEDIED